MRKVGWVLAALALFGMLTGCSVVGMEPQGLMQPPRATGDKQKVYDAFEQVIGNQNFTLKYPRTGEHRSAILMHPISEAGQEDAIALYQIKGAETPGIAITFLSKRDSVWTNVGTFQSTASQVDRVAFGDLNGDGRDEIIVGWGNGVTSLAELSVYAYNETDSMIHEAVPSDSATRQVYNEFVLCDLDQDGTQDIFTASLGTAETPANGKLLSLSENHKLEVVSSVPLDRDVIQYSHISAGKIDAKTNGVLLDGTTSSSQMLTELVYWDASQQVLLVPFQQTPAAPSDEALQSVNPTVRRIPVYSGPRGEQQVLQMPILELLPGYPADEQTPDAYLTHWYRYDTVGKKTVQESVQYLNFTNQYAFTIPAVWTSQVTAQVEEDHRSVTFYQWKKADGESQTGSRGDALLKLQAVPESEWAKCEQDPSLSLLLEHGETRVYASFPNPQNPLACKPDQLRSQVVPFQQNA